MSGGGKGGSQTSAVEIPRYLENASKKSLNRAEDTQNIGYMPYMGPDVAAFTSPQTQAMQANLDAGAAFGLVDPGMDAMAGMPEAQDFGGVQGYSSFPMYQMAVDDLAESRPGQVDAYNKLYVDPITGEGGHTGPNYGGYSDNPHHNLSMTPGPQDSGGNPYDSTPHINNPMDPYNAPDPMSEFNTAPLQQPDFQAIYGPQNVMHDAGPFQLPQDEMFNNQPFNDFQAASFNQPPPMSFNQSQPMSFNQAQARPSFNQGLDMTSAQLLGSKFNG